MTPELCDNLQVTKGTFTTHKDLKVHYWRYASPNLDKEKFPVVIINGGPGMPHDYDLPLRQLACRGQFCSVAAVLQQLILCPGI